MRQRLHSTAGERERMGPQRCTSNARPSPIPDKAAYPRNPSVARAPTGTNGSALHFRTVFSQKVSTFGAEGTTCWSAMTVDTG